MFEEQNQALEVRGFELAVNAVKRMRNGVCDLRFLQILLQLENIVADAGDVSVLRFRDSPNQKMNLAGILREIGRDLLAQECLGQIGDLPATIDRVVIGDRDKIHSLLDELAMQIAWIGAAAGKIEAPKQPLLGTRAGAGMNMKIATAHLNSRIAASFVRRSNPDRSSMFLLHPSH